jgi:hypothetical protein
MSEQIEITRRSAKIILPKDVFDKLISEGYYITINNIKRKDRIYRRVMVCKKQSGKIIFRTSLGRVILNAPKNLHVDHIDRDPLNNRISNLRLANFSQNGANRLPDAGKKFKGVYKTKNRFAALCRKNGVRYRAGTFATEEEAAMAYNELAKWLFGEYAGLNDEISPSSKNDPGGSLSMSMSALRAKLKTL